AAQSLGAARQQSVQDEWWKREIVNELRFVRAVPEVGHVVAVGDVGLGDQHHLRRHLVEQRAPELDDAVCLWKMNAGRVDLLPEIGDRVKPYESSTPRDVEKQDIDQRKQHLRLVEVQVHLVSAECRPDLLLPCLSGEGREQGKRAWPHDPAEISGVIDRYEPASVAWIVAKEALKPFALS